MAGERPGQERINAQQGRHGADPPPDPAPAAPVTSARKAELDADIDSVLDEIDSVLETNAEEFVRGFIQKGGQ